MAISVEIKDKKLVITADIDEPKKSASGKTMVIASTHGNIVTPAQYQGKPIILGMNCYFKP
jgi:hypothetical protein